MVDDINCCPDVSFCIKIEKNTKELVEERNKTKRKCLVLIYKNHISEISNTKRVVENYK